MSCVNTKYTPAELESIFLWDAMCDTLPLTLEERREIRDRDRDAGIAESAKRVRKPLTEAQLIKKRECNRRWRERNREKKAACDAAYREKNREDINAKQRERSSRPKLEA